MKFMKIFLFALVIVAINGNRRDKDVEYDRIAGKVIENKLHTYLKYLDLTSSRDRKMLQTGTG